MTMNFKNKLNIWSTSTLSVYIIFFKGEQDEFLFHFE